MDFGFGGSAHEPYTKVDSKWIAWAVDGKADAKFFLEFRKEWIETVSTSDFTTVYRFKLPSVYKACESVQLIAPYGYYEGGEQVQDTFVSAARKFATMLLVWNNLGPAAAIMALQHEYTSCGCFMDIEAHRKWLKKHGSLPDELKTAFLASKEKARMLAPPKVTVTDVGEFMKEQRKIDAWKAERQAVQQAVADAGGALDGLPVERIIALTSGTFEEYTARMDLWRIAQNGGHADADEVLARNMDLVE